MPTQLLEQLLEQLQKPKKVSGDSGSVEAHTLKEQLEVVKLLLQTKGTKRRDRGLKFNKLTSPGPE